MLPYHFLKYIVEKDISFYVAPLNPCYLEQEGLWSRIFKALMQTIKQKNQNQVVFLPFYNYLEFFCVFMFVIKYVKYGSCIYFLSLLRIFNEIKKSNES